MSARILVVDDVPANVKLLEARLSAEYFDVLTASNGAEALDLCSRSECDIILLDVMMPDMDGPTTFALMRERPHTAKVPVVFMTARAQTHELDRLINLGAAGVIAKPFDPMTLPALVRRYAPATETRMYSTGSALFQAVCHRYRRWCLSRATVRPLVLTSAPDPPAKRYARRVVRVSLRCSSVTRR